MLGNVFSRPLVWGVVLGLALAVNPEWLGLAALSDREAPTEARAATPLPAVVPSSDRAPEPAAELPRRVETVVQRAPSVVPEPAQVRPSPQVREERSPTVPEADGTTLQVRPAPGPRLAAQERAVAQARRHLPRFLNSALNGGPDWQTAALKVRFELGGITESLWVETFTTADDGGFVGVLFESAVVLPGFPKGAQAQFSIDQIEDWGFERDRRGYGYFTAHAELPYMSPSDRTTRLAFLADDPVPPGW